MNGALLGAIALVVLVAVATTRADVDLWGHVRFGTDILETHRIAAADLYSFTSDRAWINHEWLSEVVFAEAWRLGGNPGLIAVKVSCTLGALALLSLALQGGGIGSRAQVPLLGLALVGILPRVNHVRPQVGIFEGPQSVLLANATRMRGRGLPVERVEIVPLDRCFPGL